MINDFVKISRYASKSPDFVQGGGGNTSIKDGKTMVIKASGYFLSEVDNTSGYVIMDLEAREVLKVFENRPSIEWLFHTILGKVVIHTHAIGASLLCCAKKGESLKNDIFKNTNETIFLWIDYEPPGRPLAESIEKKILGINIHKDIIIFIENHGLIVSSVDVDRAMSMHEEVNNKILGLFGLNQIEEAVPNRYISPDHVVYDLIEVKTARQKIAIEEMKTYVTYVEGTIPSFDEVQYLSKGQIEFIRNMESEKHRQKVLEEI